MSLLFHKDFSDALTGANGFDSVGALNGTIVQSAGAGLNGTSGGVTCARTANSPNCYGYIDYSLTGASVLRTAWYTNLSSLAITGDNINTALYRGLWSGVQSTVAVVVYRIAGALRTYLYLYNDSNVFTNAFVVLGLPSWFELRVQRASGVGVSDGTATLYAGGGVYAPLGEQILQVTGVRNYTSFGNDNRALLGMNNIFATGVAVTGSIVIDEWTIRNDDTPILFGVSQESESGRPYDLDQLLDLTTIRM